MSAQKLLLETLEDLLEDDFKKFKWFLSMEILGHCKPVPRSQLQNASRTDTVDKMVTRYGKETAVNLAVEILCETGNNQAAKTLLSAYKGAESATASTSSSAAAPPAAAPAAAAPAAAPAAISVSNGAVLIAPNISTGGSTGHWTLNIK
ncbi:caspase b-like [Cheilinus undulatus]|uniref:caspase b-like n=1 Tax=Cheilinus undulatus TaxID=241271 RepID=UPI001BD1F58E|nr:caspase b-like [Cheilinus undulatus]